MKTSLLCSTEFLWGSEQSEAVRSLIRYGCDGAIVSCEPPHYFPSRLHPSTIRALREVVRSLDAVVAVRAPVEDINLFSLNPYLSEASEKSILEAASLAGRIEADFLVVRPHQGVLRVSPAVASRRLASILSKLPMDQYVALELVGVGSSEIASQISEDRIGFVYVHGMTPSPLLKHRRLVGVALEILDTSDMIRIIPGIRPDIPYVMIYPKERKILRSAKLREVVRKTKRWMERALVI